MQYVQYAGLLTLLRIQHSYMHLEYQYKLLFILITFVCSEEANKTKEKKKIQKNINTTAKVTFVKRKWLAVGSLIDASARRLKPEE